jgi:probable F420-dependent oxidoreductase
MSHPRALRFGVQLSGGTGTDWLGQVRQAEELGYSSVFVPDHFGDQLAPIPALTAAAAATTDLRVGSLVFDNDYRHPVVLAKEIASLDVLSGGRVEFGLGAGWMNSDYDQSGIPHDRAGVRIDRLEEAITVIKGLFAEGPTSFSGDHYTVTGLDGLPKPVQQPHPPFLIGGGAPRVLRLAGREADIVGVNPAIRSGNVDEDAGRDMAPGITDRKLEWVREGAGDRFDDIELNMLVFAVIVTDDRDDLVAKLAPRFGLSTEELADSPHVWIGTTAQIADDLRRWRDRWGVSYWVVQGPALEAVAPVVAELAGANPRTWRSVSGG